MVCWRYYRQILTIDGRGGALLFMLSKALLTSARPGPAGRQQTLRSNS